MQYVVDSGGGTSFCLKCFLCRHQTMTLFPFICYLQNVNWACERLVWRHTRACILKQPCAWSDELFQPCCAMWVSEQPVQFQLRFFLHMWVVDRHLCYVSFCIIFTSKHYLFLSLLFHRAFCSSTNTNICYFIKLKYTLKCSYMFRADDILREHELFRGKVIVEKHRVIYFIMLTWCCSSLSCVVCES